MTTAYAIPQTLEAPGPTKPELGILLDTLGVTPSEPQLNILEDRHRTILVAGGERAGKSWVSGCFGATRTPYGSRFWIIADTYELARPEFDYWTDHLIRLGAIRSTRDISLPKIGKASAVTKSGQIIETKTADDVRKIAALAPDGIIMAEAAQMTYEVYLKCVGRVAETRGWILLSGTFEGSLGWYPEKFDEWALRENFENARSYSLPTWSNTIIYPGGREDPEILRLEMVYSRVPGMFEERCGAVPVPPSNLIFREYRTTVHTTRQAKFDPTLPVYLAIDPSSGGDPYAVLACQFPKFTLDPATDPETVELESKNPDKIDYCDVIDEYYEVNTITEDIVNTLKEQVWWKNVRGGAIDPEAPDEKKRWMKYGRVPLVGDKIDIFQGIRRVKSFLHYKRDERGIVVVPPHLRLNPETTKSLQYEIGHFKRKVLKSDTIESPNQILDKVDTNQLDHSIKALWYLLIARYGDVKAPLNKRIINTWKGRRK